MKKHLMPVLVFLLAGTARMCAQSPNYADETLRIKTFTSIYAKKTITFNIAGGVPVPVAANAVDYGNEQTAVLAAYPTLDPNVVKNEFLYINFLLYDQDVAHLKAVIANFPAQFTLLSKTALVPNADIGSTNFTNLQSNIIYGITDFVISRAKEELVETYLSKWYDYLNNDAIIQPLIPQTLGVFKAFNGDNSLSLAAYGDKFKSAFQQDLGGLPKQFEKEDYVDMVLGKAGIANTSQIGPVITGGDRLVYELSEKKHLVSVLNEMGSDYIGVTEDNPAYFKRLVILSSVFLTAGGQMYKDNNTYNPVTLTSLTTLHPDGWQLLLKLMYLRQHTQLAYAIGDVPLDKFMSTHVISANTDAFIALFKKAIDIVSSYQNAITAKASQSTVNLSFNDVQKLVELSFDLVDNMESYRQLFAPDAAAESEYQLHIKPYFTYLAEIGEGIQTQQYANVLDGTIGMLNLIDKSSVASPLLPAVTVPNGQRVLAVIPANANVAITENATNAMDRLITVSNAATVTPVTSGTLSGTIVYLQKYGSFMLNIISAKNGTDVSAALDELVPKGDYKFKNSPATTIAISTFPGVFGGVEYVSKYQTGVTGAPLTNLPKVHNRAFSASVYLPVGFDLNFGTSAAHNTVANPRYSSWGLFLQAADLGAVLSYRLGGDNTVDSAPNITFKQILSPGLSLTHHFINSPVVIGGGVNYGPDLRKIYPTAGNAYTSNALRVGLFVAVDVTFFNLIVKKY